MRLTDILSPACVKVPLAATEKEGIIAEMVDLVHQAGRCKDPEQMLRATLEREATRTTGIGNGLGIPHGKCPAVDELVMAVGKTAEPVDFASIDGKPVSIVIFLASPPDKTGPHIQALARISRLMTDPKFRHELDQAQTPEQIYQLLQASEGNQQG